MSDVRIVQHKSGHIELCQDLTDIILLTPEQALKLAHRLMSLASSQGPSDPQFITPKGEIH